MSEHNTNVSQEANNYFLKFHKVCGMLGALLAFASVVLMLMASGSNEMMAIGMGGLLIGLLLVIINFMEGQNKKSSFVVAKD